MARTLTGVLLIVAALIWIAHLVFDPMTVRRRWQSIYPPREPQYPTTTPGAVERSIRNLRRQAGKED